MAESENKPSLGLGATLPRFLTPGFVVTLQALWKFGAKISPKAEVEITPNLRLGKKSVVNSFVKIKSKDDPLQIGNHVEIASFCVIISHKAGAYIGDDCLIGPNGSIIGKGGPHPCWGEAYLVVTSPYLIRRPSLRYRTLAARE